MFADDVLLSLNPFSYIGKRSDNIEADEGPQLFLPNCHMSIKLMIIKFICRAMLVILRLIGISPSYIASQQVINLLTIFLEYVNVFIVWLLGLREIKKIQAKKEKNI